MHNRRISVGAKELSFDPPSWLRKAFRYDELSEEFKAAAGFSNLCDPITYLDEHFRYTDIFRFIATHPHMDHLTGLAELRRRRKILNFWYTARAVDPPDFAASPACQEDWLEFQQLASGATPVTAISPKRLDAANFWTDDGVEIWLPDIALEQRAVDEQKPNLASYVLAIRYGETLVVLGGDAEEEVWKALYEHQGNTMPSVTILKASHHGRRSGYHQPSVAAMRPELTVASVGKKPDNDAHSLYSQYSTVVSTRYHGNIVVTCQQDGSWSYESDRTRSEFEDSTKAVTDAVTANILRAMRRLGVRQ